jgi:hypothetical protein
MPWERKGKRLQPALDTPGKEKRPRMAEALEFQGENCPTLYSEKLQFGCFARPWL